MYGDEEKDTTSRKNIKDHGEVFTPLFIVDKMIDLLPVDYMKDPNSCYIEPTSGNGQILIKLIERRLSFGIQIEQILNTLIGMEINENTLLESHERIFKIVAKDMIDKGIVPLSNIWFTSAIRCVAIVKNNIFKVENSLQTMKEYRLGTGLLALKNFVFDDPTGNKDTLTKKELKTKLEEIKLMFLEFKKSNKHKELSPFFTKE